MDLEPAVFEKTSARAIAASVKLLTFYVNRAGKASSERDRAKLERAKSELRALFHRPAPKKWRTRRARRRFLHGSLETGGLPWKRCGARKTGSTSIAMSGSTVCASTSAWR
ncbi:MAG: DUF3175 domain-containing protein [Polyangiales bacterium]